MEYHCLICGEPCDKFTRLSHLKFDHNLMLFDMVKYHVFGWYPHQLKIKISGNGLCPLCGTKPSTQIFDFRIITKETAHTRYLLRCPRCYSLFFIYKNSKGEVVRMNMTNLEEVVSKEDRSCKKCQKLKEHGNVHVCYWHVPLSEVAEESFHIASGCEGYEPRKE